MKKILSVLMCIAMLCTLFACLSSVFVSAATTTPKSLVGKQLTGFNTVDWTPSSDSAFSADGKLIVPGGSDGTNSAQSKEEIFVTGKLSIVFDLTFANGYGNYYNEYASVSVGTNQIRIRNNTSYVEGEKEHYCVEVYNSTGLVATAHLGRYDSKVNGHYEFTYINGTFSATFKDEPIMFTVGDTTAESIALTPDFAVNGDTANVTIANNYGPAEKRFIANFGIRGSANGDINGDDSVTSADLLLAEQAMIGIETTVPASACDTDYDNCLSANDLLSLKQHLLGLGLMKNYIGTPVNIMCVGDSITEGVGTLSGWRYSLFERLYSAGANFRLVGSYTTTADFRLPAGYQGHSAVGGHKISDVVNSLEKYMSNDFDVFAIMIGTNDLNSTNVTTSMANYHTVLDAVYEKNPNALVYVSTMCPNAYTVNDSTWLTKGVNAYLPAMVEEYTELGYKITYVDNFTNMGWSASDFPATDIVHPTEQGRAKIAAAFFNAMKNDVLNMQKEIKFTYTPDVKVTDFTLSDTDVALEVGTAKTVTAEVAPYNAVIKNIVWTTDNASIATVTDSGRITGKGVGNTVIRARSMSGNIVKTVNVTVSASTAAASTQLFKETFENLNNWTASSDIISINNNTAGTGMTANGATLTGNNSYNYVNGFELSFDYKVWGNEGAYWDGIYGSVSYAGFELRSVDCGRHLVLYLNGTQLGSYSTYATINYVNCKLIYKDGVANVYYDNEPVITANCTATSTGSAIVYNHSQLYRNTSVDNIYLGTY